jgi:hypothetical protein
MKNFCLGFFVCLSICLMSYTIWEHHRHVPVIVKQVFVPIPMSTAPPVQPEPAFDTTAFDTENLYNLHSQKVD